MTTLELQAHVQELSVFISQWSAKQETLLRRVAVRSTAEESNMPPHFQSGSDASDQPQLRSLQSLSSNLNFPHTASNPEFHSECNAYSHIVSSENAISASENPICPSHIVPLENATPASENSTCPSHTAPPKNATPASENATRAVLAQADSGQISWISDVNQASMPVNHLKEQKQSALRPANRKNAFRSAREMTNEFATSTLGNIFSISSSVVIVFNSVTIALAANYAMEHPTAPTSITLSLLELVCAIFYTLELAINMCTQGRKFWTGWDWKWNVFDTCLVLQAAVEQVERYIIKESSMANLSFVRMLRLLKTLKLLRVIRVLRSFRELRLLLSSLFSCFQSFGWACFLMLSICFMVSVCLMQFCGLYVYDHNGDQSKHEVLEGIDKYWSNVSTSCLSLIMASTGGMDWGEIAEPLKDVGLYVYAIFLMFIALFHFVLLNIINSIFIETMMTDAARDSQFIIEFMMEKKEDYISKLQLLYEEIDQNEDGEITYAEFIQHTESEELRAFVDSMDIDVSDARHFFRVLSGGGKRPVDLQSFVDGCIKMKGMARSMDLMDLLYQHKCSVAEQKEFHQHISVQLERIENSVFRNLVPANSPPSPRYNGAGPLTL